MKNYYDVLGLEPEVSADEITAQYEFLREALDPNRYQIFDRAKAQRASTFRQQLDEAYAVLGKPDLRRDYDAERAAALAPPALLAAAPSAAPIIAAPPQPTVPAQSPPNRTSFFGRIFGVFGGCLGLLLLLIVGVILLLTVELRQFWPTDPNPSRDNPNRVLNWTDDAWLSQRSAPDLR